jgi:threonine dehydratase
VGEIPFALLASLRTQTVLVEDAAIVDAQRALWRVLRIAVEPGGAAALAALQSGAYRARPGERIGVLLCGANTTEVTR